MRSSSWRPEITRNLCFLKGMLVCQGSNRHLKEQPRPPADQPNQDPRAGFCPYQKKRKEMRCVCRRAWLRACEACLVRQEQEWCRRLLLPVVRDKGCYLHCFGMLPLQGWSEKKCVILWYCHHVFLYQQSESKALEQTEHLECGQ